MSSIPSLQAYPFHHASDIPQGAWDALLQNEEVSNIVLAFAKKALTFKRDDNQLWIVLSDKSNKVAFVLSCTRGVLGNYPIFIVPCGSSAQSAQEGGVVDLGDAMSALVHCLLQEVPPQRIFSVFSIAKVARAFSEAFVTLAGGEHRIRAHDKPYYEAALSPCTQETFIRPDTMFRQREGEDILVNLRRAKLSDLDGVKRLCQAFSETSPPYELDDTRVELEARTMIDNNQVWVHIMQQTDQEIACLVATTRESENVIAVTKVITAPKWRKRGCALRLLHRVCDEMIKKKKRVVLYVGTSDDLRAAREVYKKVGFQGLEEERIQQMSDSEKWLEIGFEPTTLGYW